MTYGTWAITATLDGESWTDGGYTAAEAQELAAELRTEDPGARAHDLLPPLAARFPVGARVRNTGSGTLGTVAEQGPDGVFNDERSAHTVLWRGEEAVSVHWDGSRWPSWTVAKWVEPLAVGRPRPEHGGSARVRVQDRSEGRGAARGCAGRLRSHGVRAGDGIA